MKNCWRCGQLWEEKRTPGSRKCCEGCGEPLHCCRNCRFFEHQASQWCREPMARDEKPRDSESGNTCSYFLMAEDRTGNFGRSSAARAAAEALFGDAVPIDEEPAPDWMSITPPPTDDCDIESIFKPPNSP